MKMPRFSLAGLMTVVLAVALNVAIARELWADGELLAEIAVAGLALQLGLVGAVRTRGRAQRFWAGFVVSGVLALATFSHLLFPFNDWVSNYWFRTEQFADRVLHTLGLPCNLHGDTRIRPSAALATTLVERVWTTEVAPHVFLNFLVSYAVIRSLPILAVAVAGGLLASALGEGNAQVEQAVVPDGPREDDLFRHGRLIGVLGLVTLNTVLGLFVFAYGLNVHQMLAPRLGVALVGLVVQFGLWRSIRTQGRVRAYWAGFTAAGLVAASTYVRAYFGHDAPLQRFWSGVEAEAVGLLRPAPLSRGLSLVEWLIAAVAVPQLLLAVAGGLLAATTRAGRRWLVGLAVVVLIALIAVLFIPRRPAVLSLPPARSMVR